MLVCAIQRCTVGPPFGVRWGFVRCPFGFSFVARSGLFGVRRVPFGVLYLGCTYGLYRRGGSPSTLPGMIIPAWCDRDPFTAWGNRLFGYCASSPPAELVQVVVP